MLLWDDESRQTRIPHRSLGKERGLPIVGTESRKRNVAQKSHVSLNDILEKLFGRGGRLSKGAMVALGQAFREAEVIFPLHVDVLEAQRS